MSENAAQLAKRYWELMATNDFRSVGSLLSDNFVLDWPQSNERIRGRDNLATMNEEYPAHGRWQFTVNRIVGNDLEAVSDVWVTDRTQRARVISFFTTRNGKIVQMIEFWPNDYLPHENRKHLTEPIGTQCPLLSVLEFDQFNESADAVAGIQRRAEVLIKILTGNDLLRI